MNYNEFYRMHEELKEKAIIKMRQFLIDRGLDPSGVVFDNINFEKDHVVLHVNPEYSTYVFDDLYTIPIKDLK